MRIVKWNPQERVDVPDITAQNFLMLGEFRRSVRGALGIDANSIIHGFAVEPNTVPDSTVVVKLDNGGGDLSFAFGSEDIGARTDYGQIIGGDNSDGNTEGNAQQSIDFIAQPDATYTVKMRFSYTDGANDNRAFWNEGTNSEFIAAVDTRHLPQFEIAINPVGDEWISLADVVWNSGVGVIGTSDITDLREGPFEGPAPYQQTTKLGSGGMPDFTRSATRADTGLNAVYPAIRGLARQIQDIKGSDDAGNWNWWNDPYLPLDPSNTLTRDQTTNLRSLRTVHYTIGDGLRTFGDFNGYGLGEGLDACLTHVETEEANINGRVIIQILVSGDGTSTGTPFQVTNYSFGNCSVEILGGGADNRALHSWIRPVGTLTTPVFSITSGTLDFKLQDIRFSSSGPSPIKLVFMSNASTFIMRGCYGLVPGTVAAPTFELGRGNNIIEDNELYYSTWKLAGGNNSANSIMQRCLIGGEIEIDGANNWVFRDLFITQIDNALSMVTITNAHDLVFDNCRFYANEPDEDNVHIDNAGGDWYNIRFSRCDFTQSWSSGVHAPDAGANGAEGTGWSIYANNTGGSDWGRGFVIEHCNFHGASHSDAGGVYMYDLEEARIIGNVFRDFGTVAGADRVTCVYADSPTIGYGASLVIANNTMGEWAAVTEHLAEHACIYIDDVRGVVINGNRLFGPAVIGNGRENGVRMIDSDYTVISGNSFHNFNSTFSEGVLSSFSSLISINGNVFNDCPNAIWATGVATAAAIVGNVVWGDGVSATTGAIYCSMDYSVVSSNIIRGVGTAAMYCDGDDSLIVGNQSDGQFSDGIASGQKMFNSTHNVATAFV